MNNNDKKQEELHERWDEDIIKFMEKKKEETEKQKEFGAMIDRYGGIGSDAINITELHNYKTKAFGKDYKAQEVANTLDNDPIFRKAKQRQEEELRRKEEDEKYWKKINAELKHECELTNSIKEKFGEKAYRDYLEEMKIKRMRNRLKG